MALGACHVTFSRQGVREKFAFLEVFGTYLGQMELNFIDFFLNERSYWGVTVQSKNLIVSILGGLETSLKGRFLVIFWWFFDIFDAKFEAVNELLG